MRDRKHYSGGGLGLASVLTIVFIVLKLVGTINWSWWWVLSPLWINAILVVVLFLIIFVVALITEIRDSKGIHGGRWKR
jgi:hypothetical protein